MLRSTCDSTTSLRFYKVMIVILVPLIMRCTDILYSHRKSEPMVSVRRPSVHHRGLGHGAGYDSWPRIPLLRTRTKEVGFEHDLGLYGIILRHHFPMVLLGLFVGFLAHSNERLHWRSSTLWSHEYTRCPESWVSSNT